MLLRIQGISNLSIVSFMEFDPYFQQLVRVAREQDP